MARIKLEDIRKEVEKDNWKILSNSYENLDSELIFECPEGHKVFSTWSKLRQKKECPVCKENYSKLNNKKIINKDNNKKRILAIDQATKMTGWAIFDNDQLIKFGLHETSYEKEEERINEVKNWIINMVNNWKPDYIAIEDIHFKNNKKENSYEDISITTFKVLAHLQGVIIDYLYETKIPYYIVSSATWRSYCKISGRTKVDMKKSAQLKVKDWYDVSIGNDEADAICIGRYATSLTKEPEIIMWEK